MDVQARLSRPGRLCDKYHNLMSWLKFSQVKVPTNHEGCSVVKIGISTILLDLYTCSEYICFRNFGYADMI